MAALVGCAPLPSELEGQKIVWRVSVAERFLDRTADELVRLPTRFEGRETWWVSDEAISVETRGGLPHGRVSEKRTWILPRAAMVYVADYGKGQTRAIRLARFEEERRRRSRAAMVATIRTIASRPGGSDVTRYSGDLSVEELGKRHRLAALPGREWILGGHRPASIAWSRFPLLPLGFEDVSELEARPLARRLADRDPREIVMQPLPTGHVGVRLHYNVQSVRPALSSEARTDLSAEMVERASRRERGLADFDLLWRFWLEPAVRPDDLDVRALRVRMEPLVAREHRPRIETRLDESKEIEEIEELLHLLYVLDRAVFDNWYRSALESGDLPRVLACISVCSLRRPDRPLVEELDRLLGRRELYGGLTLDQAREARTWFQGVRYWVANRRLEREPTQPESLADRQEQRIDGT